MRKPLLIAELLSLWAALAPASSHAEMWCADPLWVHEWGVQVFASGGARRTGSPTLPSYYHDQPVQRPSTATPTRHLPIDGGMRHLPIVQFYSTRNWTPVPLGFEVGFTRGEAARWYPEVDHRVLERDANGAQARDARARLLTARAGRTAPMAPPLPADPTRQLEWASLTLTDAAQHTPHASEVDWVDALRNVPGTLWVNGASESERFLFYDARSTEQPAIAIERGPTFGPQRHHYLLRNRGTHAVHDVFLVQRDAAGAIVFYAPSIPPGAYAGLLLEEHRVAPPELVRVTRDRLRTTLIDFAQRAPPLEYRWDRDHCVMRRDPGAPFERADGHRLYAAEVERIVDIWGTRFFDQVGTTLLYREDPAYLDEVMPLSVYTDMFHFVQLRRAGLALQEQVALP